MRLPARFAPRRCRSVAALLVPLLIVLLSGVGAPAAPLFFLPLIGSSPSEPEAAPVRIEVSDPNPVDANKTISARVVAAAPAGPGGLMVSLSSDHPELVLTATEVTIPQGLSAAGFQLEFPYPVSVPTTVILTARVGSTATTYRLEIRDLGQPLPSFARGAGDPPVYNPVDQHWYQAVRVPGGITWPDARDAATAASYAGLPGHLITMSYPEEEAFVLDRVLPADETAAFWLGGYRDPSFVDYPGETPQWHWITGEPGFFAHWLPGQPDVSPGELAAGQWKPAAGGWDDSPYGQPGDGYLVEYEPPVPATVSQLSISARSLAGGQSALGQVTLAQPAGPHGAVVHLVSDDPDHVQVPDNVTVAAGQRSATFPVTTVPVATDQAIGISATGGTDHRAVAGGQLRGLVPPRPGASWVSPPVYDPDTGHWYQQITLSHPHTGAAAEGVVEALSFAGGRGHLATVTSAAEADFITRLIANNAAIRAEASGGIWLGGFRGPNEAWRWVTGEPWSYATWNNRLPYAPPAGGGWLEFRSDGTWDNLPESATQGVCLVEYQREPANLRAALAGPTQAAVTWTDNSTDETGFELQRSGPGSDWARIATPPANSSRFVDSALGTAGHYRYRVRALGPNGPSGWSGSASVDAGPGASLSLEVASYDFGAVFTGTTGIPLIVTLASNGAAPLQIRGVTLAGADAGEFSVAGAPAGAALAPGASASLTVIFAPRPAGGPPGRRSAVLTIQDNAPGSPHTIPLAGTAAPALPAYVIADLGILDNRGVTSWSSGEAINNLAQIAGGSSGNTPHAFLDDGAGLRDLSGPAGSAYSSDAHGINDRGDVAGITSYGTASQPFLYAGGEMRALPTLGGSHGEARAVKDADQVVGTAELANPLLPWTTTATHAFLFESGRMQDLGTLGGHDSYALAINNAGQVVGMALATTQFSRAFLYDGGTMTDLNDRILPSSGWELREADAINDAGQIAGVGTLQGLAHAFRLDGANLIDLGSLGYQTGTLGQLDASQPDGRVGGINAAGQVVGTHTTPGREPVAFLYSGGVRLDLNHLLPAGSGWRLQQAHAINDAGQIVGTGMHNGQQRAFLLTFPGAPHRAAPAAPGDLAARAVSATEIDLTWTDDSNNEDAFAVWRQNGGGAWQQVGQVIPNSNHFEDRGLTPGGPYTYRVAATTGNLASDWSGTVTLTTPPPPAPGTLTATVTAGPAITLTWANPSPDPHAYVTVWRQEGTGAWTRVALLPGDATTFTDVTVSVSASYTYQAHWVNGPVVSPWSNLAHASTVGAALAPPSGLAATVGSGPQVRLTWSLPAPNPHAYLTLWRQQGTGEWTRVALLRGDARQFTDTTVQPGTSYSYHAHLVTDPAVSAWSNTAVVTTPTAGPAQLTAAAGPGARVTLSWRNPRPDAHAWLTVWRQAGTGAWTRVALLHGDAASFTDTQVSAGSSYRYRAHRVDGADVSDWSNEASAVLP